MANTTNFNWETPDDTDLVKDGAAAIRTLGNSIDTSFVDLKGGTTGQVLSKASNTDLDFSWVAQDDSNAIQNAIFDAKADILTATAADTPARLAVGANDTVLTADSSTATGLKWAAPAGGGKVLQVVSAVTSTSTTISSGTYADSTITATITPTLATSKILVIVSAHATATKSASGTNMAAKMRLMRDAVNIWEAERAFFLEHSTTSTDLGYAYSAGITYLDSPATTSATTYKIQGAYVVGNAIIFQNAGISDSTITLLEIGV